MDVIKITCPHCHSDLMVKNRVGVEGKTFTCPSCHKKSSVREGMALANFKIEDKSEVCVTRVLDFRKLYQSDYLDYDIFVSYSRKDYDKVKTFIKDFEKEGFRVWIDKDGIESGDAFKSTIVSAIEKSKIFLFFSSEVSNKSEWTAKEIGIANARKKPIIPIKLDNSQYNKIVEFDLVNLDFIDYTDERCQKANREKLIKTLNVKIEKVIDPVDNPEPTKPTNTEGEQDLAKSKTFWQNHKRECFFALITICALAVIVPMWVGFNRSQSSESTNVDKASIVFEDELMPVDLGLPSGTLWANINVGAETITDFGDLFAFGETYTRDDYDNGLYLIGKQLNPNICYSTFDVAKRKLGEEWALPTAKQFQELIDECQWTWTKSTLNTTPLTNPCSVCSGSGVIDGSVCIKCKGTGMISNHSNGHWGYMVTGKNGNSIFLPAAGRKSSSELEYQNQYGYYWTGEQTQGRPGLATNLNFSSGGYKLDKGYMSSGRSVRAVYFPDMAVAE